MNPRKAEPRSARRSLLLMVALAGAGAALLAILAVLAPPRLQDGVGLVDAAFLAAAALTGLSLGGAVTFLAAHFAELNRLQRLMLAGDSVTEALPAALAERDRETAGLAAAAAEAIGRWRARAEAPDRKLSEVLGALPEAVLVVTGTGLVSLVNAAAKGAFGERAGVGTSVFDLLHRERFATALEAANRAGRPVAADLLDVSGRELSATLAALEDGGAVITCPAWQLGAVSGVEQDLRLHESPPPRPSLGPDTPLEELPAVVLDTETTGLEVATDRIIALAAVPMHGTRIFPAHAIDRLMNPGRAIPGAATAIHGISDALVREAPSAGEVLPGLFGLLEGAVLVGHSIGFDVALLRREAERAGMAWRAPPLLDTAQLAAALMPDLADLELETLAAQLGVSIAGRHTALGDALATAELFAALLRMLQRAGARNLADAEAWAARARVLRQAQRRAGW